MQVASAVTPSRNEASIMIWYLFMESKMGLISVGHLLVQDMARRLSGLSVQDGDVSEVGVELGAGPSVVESPVSVEVAVSVAVSVGLVVSVELVVSVALVESAELVVVELVDVGVGVVGLIPPGVVQKYPVDGSPEIISLGSEHPTQKSLREVSVTPHTDGPL